MGALEGAKTEAQALLTKEREIRKKNNILYQIHDMEARRDLKDVEVNKVTLESKLTEENIKLEATKKRVAEIEGGLSAQMAEHELLHTKLINTKKEFVKYERKDIQLR